VGWGGGVGVGGSAEQMLECACMFAWRLCSSHTQQPSKHASHLSICSPTPPPPHPWSHPPSTTLSITPMGRRTPLACNMFINPGGGGGEGRGAVNRVRQPCCCCHAWPTCQAGDQPCTAGNRHCTCQLITASTPSLTSHTCCCCCCCCCWCCSGSRVPWCVWLPHCAGAQEVEATV